MNKDIKLKAEYLFYFCDGMGSVFDSQVMSLLEGINERNVFKKIYLFLGIKNEEQKNYFLTSKSTPEIEPIFFKTYPNYPFFNFLIRRNIKSAVQISRINLDEVIFHTRGELTAWHLSKILEKKYHKNIVADVRGASVEEIEEFYDSKRFLKYFKIKNSSNAVKYLSNIKAISVVSDSLKKYLIEKFKTSDRRLFVTPCLAGSDFIYDTVRRDKVRRELNLNDEDTLIVFTSGGSANWQNNEIILRFAEKGLKVLNLSKKEIRHKNIVNKFVDYSEIPAYLNAADAAIIWRDISIVNKVASPVKFSEYVCCGLPVIANNSVDMISEYLTNYDCGILIDSLDCIDAVTLKNLMQKNRKMISDMGILNFGIETGVYKYFKIYSSINNL